MIPRVTVPDPRDMALIWRALVQLSDDAVTQIQMGELEYVGILSRASQLLVSIRDAEQQDPFGPVPTDEDIARALEDFGGDNPTGNN
jgi:hypothetical protein